MPTKSVLETLEAARKLIEKPAMWTQGRMKDQATGARCAAGALCAIDSCEMAFSKAYDIVESVAGEKLTIFNDTHTHAEVLAAFDAAIAKEKEAQHA